MFTAYIDDSGTAPGQKVANAAALVLPAHRLAAFHSEWKNFANKWGITDFHASECAKANPKSDFAGRKEEEIKDAFQRIRQIIRRYGTKAFSLSVNKDDYEAAVPATEKPIFGNFHYTYAVQSLVMLLDDFALRSSDYPMEYVFDWIDEKAGKRERKEIDNVMDRSERSRPGRFAGRYSFRKRVEVPGLQCVDLIAWICYRSGLQTFGGPPLTALQQECLADFQKRNGGHWLTDVGQFPHQLRAAVKSAQGRGPNMPTHVVPRIFDVS